MPDVNNMPWWLGMIYWNIYYFFTIFIEMTVLKWWNFVILTFFLLFTLFLQKSFGTATLRDYKTEGPYEVGFKSFYSKVHQQRIGIWYPIDREFYNRSWNESHSENWFAFGEL